MPDGGERSRECDGDANSVSYEVRKEYAMELNQDSRAMLIGERSGVANVQAKPMPREAASPNLRLVASCARVLSHPSHTPNDAQDGARSACQFTNASWPIAAARAHRPPLLPVSFAFRMARPSICKQARARSLAAYRTLCACARQICTACLNLPRSA